jgi:hypothetical protein
MTKAETASEFRMRIALERLRERTTDVDSLDIIRRALDPHAPTRKGSPRCESGSLASGGTRTYCTCDTCY